MELQHRSLYDPVKAHEYYIRTRQLKGRRKASPTFTVNLGGGKQAILTEQQLTEQRAYAAKRVAEIKTRLYELKNELRKLMDEAKKKDAKKSPTAADKHKAARESKQYRQKHKQKLATQRKTAAKKHPTKKASTKTAVAELEHKINEVKGRLTAAVERQRALASATRGS